MKSAQEEWKHDIVYDPEGQNDIYFALTYFMTSKVMVSVMAGLTLSISPKCY